MAKDQKTNDAIFARLVALRENNPMRFALTKIGVAWDDLNSTYAQNGIDQNFIARRAALKKLLSEFKAKFGNDELTKFCESHGDYVNGGKSVHGYNLNYKTK